MQAPGSNGRIDSLQVTSPFNQQQDISNVPDSSLNSNIIPGSNIQLKPDSLLRTPGDTLSSARLDSSILKPDSLAADTVKIDPALLDSTARLKYFRYHREDVPYTSLRQKKGSKFFAETSLKSKSIQIDSSGQFVEVVEKVGSEVTKVILRIPIQEYIELRMAMREKELWEEQGYHYELKDTQKGLAELIKDFTDFEIPLPSVGVLSIFGEPKISLRIGGAVDIHGAWRNETTEGATASRLGNTRNEPDFKQQVQINVSGTIGDKLNINADWNTERTFEYENQLKIKYTGYEDEIIQSIEAGNVSLQTSPLVGGSEALFGLKALFKMGPLSLTTIATQKKGEVKEVSVNSGSTSQEFSIRAFDYSKNHYFIDAVYADSSRKIFQNYYSRRDKSSSLVDLTVRVEEDIEVWKSINTVGKDPTRERMANAYIDLPAIDEAGGSYNAYRASDIQTIPGESESSRFLLLQNGTDYILHPETGYITFTTSIQDADIIAVAFKRNGKTYGDYVNTFRDTTRLVLKLVKPKDLNNNYKKAWPLLLKNIYPIGGRNINKEGFEFSIKYEVEGQDPLTDISTNGKTVRLLNGFGLDNYDASNATNPDNIFDFFEGITIMPETGEIIFPSLQPFGRDIWQTGLDTSYAYFAVYDTLSSMARYMTTKNKWMLTGKYSGQSSSVYQLGFNIVENSVVVKLNGAVLTPGVDYTVDYNIGQLTIRNEAALVPGADLKITYEQNDLFQLASKTMLGARGILDISEDTKLGFSILNLNQQTLSDKVRIGEEPLSNTIMGVDFTTSHDLPFLTKAIDKVFSTKAMSAISLSGEYAYIDPDPNTKKSTIASDQNASIAYIDDFEGTKRTIPLGVSHASWKDMSPPEGLTTLGGLTPLQMMDYKAKAFWFTETGSGVKVTNIWPNRQVGREDQDVTVMDFVYLPEDRGAFNYNPRVMENPAQNWGGMMKSLSSTANNLLEENIEFIEIWAQPDTSYRFNPANGYFYIDIGKISEDIIPGGDNTEDADGNGVLDINATEDKGLDSLTDAQERAKWPGLGDDPSGDNAYIPTLTERNESILNWRQINGTEGNSKSSDLGTLLPDKEDLNNNGRTDRVNSFFRYKVPLDTNKATNPYLAGGGDGNKRWYLYRIPLKDFIEKVGDPNLTQVEYIRFFVTNYTVPFHMRIAEFNLVGSQWQKAIANDTILSVSVINFEENPEYTIPGGVSREKDRTRPDENILRNEQSMNLVVNGLEPGQYREAVKYLYRPLDVFNYKQIKLFVHGDEHPLTGGLSDNTNGNRAEVYFRFGADSNNYYEYRQPITPGWGEIVIPFEKLTAIKEGRDSALQRNVKIVFIEDKPGHSYRVKGLPSLTSVKYLTVGIYNVDDPDRPRYRPLSGTVWVNELRVIGADDTPGWAYSVSGSMKMADLLTVNFNMSQTSAYFHKISDRFGSRNEIKNWGMSAELDVLKLLPFKLDDSNLKINYSHNESLSNPLYSSGTDIKVEQLVANATSKEKADSIRTRNQTYNVSDTWSAANIKIKIPSNYWLIRDSFNALSFAFNYNKTFSRSPTVEGNIAWIWNAAANYAINFSPEYYFRPADIPVIGTVFAFLSDYKNTKVYYAPQNFSFTVNAKRNRQINTTRATSSSASQTVISRDFGTSRGFNFSWRFTEGGFLNLTSSYSVNISSTLAHLETDDFVNAQGLVEQRQRRESQIWKDIFTKAFFGKDYQYQQNVDIRTAPKLPSWWDLNRYLTLSAGYSVSYQWQHDLKQGDIGRSAGFASRSSVGLSLRLKALSAPLFAEKQETRTAAPNRPPNMPGGREPRERVVPQQRDRTPRQMPSGTGDSLSTIRPDTPVAGSDSLSGRNLILAERDTSKAGTDSLAVNDSIKTGFNALQSLSLAGEYLKKGIQFIFFDYENITFNFSSDNSVSKSGIYGAGNGFNNFWGFSYNEYNGPSRAFMFGLSQDIGLRARGGNLTDVFSHKNTLDFKTSRPLWEGAKVDINWKVSWSINKTTNISTDPNEFGKYSIRPPNATGTLSRSFFAMPNFLFFSGGLKKVHELFDQNSANRTQALSDAFAQGFEQFPILGKLPFLKDVAKYIPRPNWRFQWDGLEKYFIFSSFVKRLSFEHAYNSNYTEGWRTTTEGDKQTQSQKVDYGFSPLAGLNFTFNDLWGGNITSSIKYGTKTGYDLGVSTSKISETYSKDIGITAGYSLTGVEIPLFGISLKNDIEFSFSYTNTKNSTVIYDMADYKEDGVPQDGSTRVTIEPRVKYSISSKVTLSLFYKRSTVEPEGAAKYPPTKTNEVGLDVHISIQ